MKTNTLACSLLIFVFIFVNQGFAQAEKKKPVEPEQKNVHFLMGLSTLQLQRTMNFIRASLGVHCDYCHVVDKENGWQWDKDDKKPKRDARKMIQMVIELNHAHYNDQPVVNCFTCHQGHIKPESLPPLPQAAPPFPTVIPGTAQEPLPAAEEVLKKYFAAIGEKAATAFENPTTLFIKGTREGSDGKSLPFEIYFKAPDKWLQIVGNPDDSLYQSVKGNSGWIKNKQEQREMLSAERERLLEVADCLTMAPVQESYESIRVLNKTDLRGRDVYLLEAKTANHKTEQLFFDAESGYLVRKIEFRDSKVGSIPQQNDYDDYREVQGARIPFMIRSDFVDPWIGAIRKFSEVRMNEPIDDSKFNP